jgi:RNA polymerase sigma factor (TIGR02999 family)
MSTQGDAKPSGEITALLHDWSNPGSRDRLVSLLYPQLRRMAAARLRWERSGHTLQPTALVSEVFLQLALAEGLDWQNRDHFFRVVSESMRRILVDYARRRLSQKRGGGASAQSVDPEKIPTFDSLQQWVEIDDLMDELEKANPRVATSFKLHHFVGFTYDQVGEALSVDRRTARRDCEFARAWLYAALQTAGSKDHGTRSTRKD